MKKFLFYFSAACALFFTTNTAAQTKEDTLLSKIQLCVKDWHRILRGDTSTANNVDTLKEIYFQTIDYFKQQKDAYCTSDKLTSDSLFIAKNSDQPKVLLIDLSAVTMRMITTIVGANSYSKEEMKNIMTSLWKIVTYIDKFIEVKSLGSSDNENMFNFQSSFDYLLSKYYL